MSEATPERRTQIMDAALRVFARQGFARATIKQIADEAGLKSPALIYWYFKNKEDLFQAVLSEHSPLIGIAGKGAEFGGLLDLPPEEGLRLIARSYIRSLEHPDALRMFRLLLSEAIRSPEVADTLVRSGVRPALSFVVAYLQRQIDLGRLRPHDPQASARSFMGSFLLYVLNREILATLRDGFPEFDPYLDLVVSLFLDGLRA